MHFVYELTSIEISKQVPTNDQVKNVSDGLDLASAKIVWEINMYKGLLKQWKRDWYVWGELIESMGIGGLAAGLSFRDKKLVYGSLALLRFTDLLSSYVPKIINHRINSRRCQLGALLD